MGVTSAEAILIFGLYARSPSPSWPGARDVLDLSAVVTVNVTIINPLASVDRSGQLMSDYLSFLVPVEDEPESGTMGPFRRNREVNLVRIPVESLKENLRASVTLLRSVLAEAAQSEGGMRLREAQVQFEISATGGIHFVGTTELGAKGAITLVFGQ